MDKIVSFDWEANSSSYLGDVSVVSETFEEYLKWLEIITKRLIEANLEINRKSHNYVVPQLNIWSSLLLLKDFKSTQKNVEAIIQFPRPKNVKQIQRFLVDVELCVF